MSGKLLRQKKSYEKSPRTFDGVEVKQNLSDNDDGVE